MFGLNKDNVQGQVTELTERLKTNASLTDEQVAQVMSTVKEFVLEKYPMMAGVVNSVLGEK